MTDRKGLRCVIWIVVLCLGALAACGLGLYIVFRALNSPDYIELDVSFPGQPGWIKTEKEYDGLFYVWKRTGQISLDTADPTAIAVHFDDWMTQQGWRRAALSDYWLCGDLDETQTFRWVREGYPSDQGGYTEYYPPHDARSNKIRGCLVIWREQGMMNVTLATFSPDWGMTLE